MNTIIYLYHSREITKFITEKWQEEDYCLIRLGIPMLLWKNLKEAENKKTSAEEQTSGMSESQEQTKKPFRRRLKVFFGRRRKKEPEQSFEQTGALKQSDDAEKEMETLRNRLVELMEELRELQIALCLLGNNPYWTYCVCEDYLREKIDTACWRKYWAIPEFEDYHEYMWVRKLMQNTIPGHYMVLGYADCLPEILCENAAKMRSFKWFLQEKEHTQEVQDFIEDFYEEYGLAVEVRTVKEEWVGVRPSSAVPVNVLDFTREEKLSAWDVADGSIWLDMDSMDGKNRRMEARNPKVSYFSLKKQWKQRQKEGFHLDTINKNGYNT